VKICVILWLKKNHEINTEAEGKIMKMKDKKNENENKQSCENLCNLVVRKRKMIKDERGQWIISAGFLVSVSIIILALLLNQAMMGGYQSSGAILEFPKHDIRELVQETHREVNIAAERAWNMSGEPIVTDLANDTINRNAIIANFTIMMSNYNSSVEYLYASHGQMVYIVPQIDTSNFNNETGEPNKISEVNVTILFSDGVTTCTFDPELIEIPIVPEQVPGPSTETLVLYAENLTSGDCTINSPANAYGASNDSVANVSHVGNMDTVEATIENYSVGSETISSVNFTIRLMGVGWSGDDKIEISYSPDAGGPWYTVDSFIPNNSSLTEYGNYTATEVDMWGEVNNMTIRITGKKIAGPDPGDLDLEIDAYHVYVEY